MTEKSRKILVDTKTYDDRKLFSKKKFEFFPGITVLVGCNGAGKTTVIDYIKKTLEKEKIPYLDYDNYHQGGSTFIENSLLLGNTEMAASAMVSSEGERINISLGAFVSGIGSFIQKNKDKEEIWFLFDALDSGFSIDNIEETKDFMKNVLIPDLKDKTVYIIISGNQYGIVENETCLDVQTGKNITFNSYEDYKKFILNSRKKKDKYFSDLEK